jgi:hypothetical protein
MIIYIHILKVNKTKLEPYENKDTFVGYRVFHMDIDEEEQVTPPVARRMTPPSTNLEESIVHRELSLRIQ